MKVETVIARTVLRLLLAAVLPTLAGCFPIAVVGVGAGALMLADRRPAETQVADEGIQVRAGNRISEKFGDKAHVSVTSYNHTVLLTGETIDAGIKSEIEKVVTGVPNVKAVLNEVQVAGSSSFGTRSNDILLTSKVKARFMEAKRFQVNHVKVVTESNVVYLLGIVTNREADDAADIARTTGGVQKVVRAFEYISEEQARQIDNRPATTDAAKKPSDGR